jgi:hypothetical protein
MSGGHSLRPVEGFNWMAVSWEGPDEPPGEICSYCDRPIRADVPLILWRQRDGWCARFCEACCRTWWGMS